MQQGSEEWLAARLGHVTASRVSDVMAKGRGGAPSKVREKYMAEIITERLTGKGVDAYTNDAMQHGTDTEAEARSAYELIADVDVTEVGFVKHPEIDWFGASPDGLVGDRGLVEIKCPNTHTHIATLLADRVPPQYIKQMQSQMVCTDRQWCDFVSYDPRLPGDMCMWVGRVDMDDGLEEDMLFAVSDFLIEVDEKITALRGKYGA